MLNSKFQPSSSMSDTEQARRHSYLSPTSATASKFYQAPLRWTGFNKPSSLVYFCLTAGVFAIFSALQTRTLEEGSPMKPNPPGGPFWFKEGPLQIVMRVHLWSVIRKSLLPKHRHTNPFNMSTAAGVLLPLQFLPAMRRRYLYLHKLSGRILFVLLLIGNLSKCNSQVTYTAQPLHFPHLQS